MILTKSPGAPVSKADEIELGERDLRADARRRREMPRGMKFREHDDGGRADHKFVQPVILDPPAAKLSFLAS